MLTNLQRHSVLFCIVIIFFWLPSDVLAHGVDENTRHFLLHNTGVQIIPFLYIGAKHMVTGYDHLLFLIGVVFFLYKSRDVVLYVSMFTLGHSLTLFFGVLIDLQVNAYLIDAIIGLSVAYKGFDNLGGVHQLFGKSANTKVAVLIFGLFHGFGLATKIIEFDMDPNGLLTNLIAFNVGVEIVVIFGGLIESLGLVIGVISVGGGSIITVEGVKT